MNPKFLLLAALLMSRISVFQATVQCPTSQKTIKGMFLRGHTFKTTMVGRPGVCYLMCEEELTCQSYNFVIGHKICELNNRTKEARPEDFKPDFTRFYMKRARNRGTLHFFFGVCLSFKCSQFEMVACVACRILFASTLFREGSSQWKMWELGVIKLLASAHSLTAVVQNSSHSHSRK